MSLPPPPGWPATPSALPSSPARAGRLDDRPKWRQGRPGWVLLNVSIGFGIWIGLLIALYLLLRVLGWSESEIDESQLDTASNVAVSLALPICITAWILFAYMRGSIGRRWIVFGGSLGVALLMTLAAMEAGR